MMQNKKYVRFVPGNVSKVVEIEPKLSPLARKFGAQSLAHFQTKSRGRLSPEKLAAIQKRANEEIKSRGKYRKAERRGRFTVLYE